MHGGVAALTLAPVALCGQTPPSKSQTAPPTPAARAAPPIATTGPVRAGRWKYTTTVTQGDKSQSLGTRTLSVTAVTYKGTAAWLILETRDAGAMQAADSLYVTRAALVPLRRSYQMGPARVVNEFTNDSILGSVVLPQGSMPIAMAMRPGVMVNGNMLEVALQGASLRRGWTGSAEMLIVGPEGAATVPVELQVVGEESVTVPAGTYQTWLTVVKGEQVDQRLWIGKDGNEIVKVAISVPQMPGTVAETALIEASGR
jgi:hypothetical protein